MKAVERDRTRTQGWPTWPGLATVAACLVFSGCQNDPAGESRPITPAFESNKERAPIGSPIEVTYRFEVDASSEPVPNDYHVFVHFLDSHDALLFTDDHAPPEPTSSWAAGSAVEYERTIFVPLYPYLGTATIKVGLWDPETGERLGLNGVDDGHLEYTVGQIQLLDQKENIFLVYKEGWHQLETMPENPNLEWQWSKQEAVCSFRNPKKDSVLYLEADTNVEAFETPLEVALLVGEQELTRFTVEDRHVFLKKIPIPAAVLGEDDWVDLRIVNSESFVPSEKGLGEDTRELGLRVFHLYVDTFTGT